MNSKSQIPTMHFSCLQLVEIFADGIQNQKIFTLSRFSNMLLIFLTAADYSNNAQYRHTK